MLRASAALNALRLSSPLNLHKFLASAPFQRFTLKTFHPDKRPFSSFSFNPLLSSLGHQCSKGTAKDSRKFLFSDTEKGVHVSKAYVSTLSERDDSLVQEIEPAELHVKMQDPKFMEEAQLIDVREPDEVAKASLPYFEVLPLQQLESLGPEITTKFDPEKETYVMCRSGRRSLKAAKWLQTQGFKKVYSISGGIHAYALKVDPSVPTY